MSSITSTPAVEPEASADVKVARLTFYFGAVYFLQGFCQLPTFLNQPVRNFLTKQHQFTPEQVAQFFFVATLPWVVKPLYGLISDFVPLLGYRRKTYLVLLNLAAAGTFLWTAGLTSPDVVLAAMVIVGVGVAGADVIVDALMVETGQRTGRIRLFQGVQWLCINVAAIGSSLLAAWIIKGREPTVALRTTMLIAMILPLLVGSITWWVVREQRSRLDLPQLKSTAGALLTAFRSLRLWAVVAFLALTAFNPGLQTPMYDHLVKNLKLDASALGVMDAFFSAGGAAGALIFLTVIRRFLALRGTLAVGIAALGLGTIPFLFVHDWRSTAIAYSTWGVGWMLSNLAAMSLAAAACPRRAEAFVFAAMMSIVNLSMQYSDVIGSRLYEGYYQEAIRPLVLWSIAITVIALPLVPFVPLGRPEEQAAASQDGETRGS